MSEVDDYNRQVSKWTQDSVRQMKNRILRLVLNIGAGYNKTSGSVTRYHGEAAKISFSFPYYMAFVEKGAGRGYGGSKSGKFTTKLGGKQTTNPASFGLMGTGARKPKPWFNPVIQDRFPELADMVAMHKGDQVILNIQRILIK